MERSAAASSSDWALGIVGGAMVLLAVVLVVRSLLGFGAADASAPAAPPVITLLAPAAGAVVADPVPLEFRVDADLRPTSGGWGAGGLHLHAEVDGREVMPGGDAIVRLEGGSYRWTLPIGAPGEHNLRLRWAGAGHRPLATGEIRAVMVRIEPMSRNSAPVELR
ncbi:hypothetical protein BH23GEM4_BH23GEM4_00340 [soil metagenome]